MLCIICLTEDSDKDTSLDHVFPEAMGGTLTNRRVCRACNSHLGSEVDVLLTDHFFVQALRQVHRIPGKSGKVPNPLENGVLTENSAQKVKYIFDKDGLPKHLHLTPYILHKIDGNQEVLQVIIDEKDASKLSVIVNKILRRSGRNPLSEEEIFTLSNSDFVHNPEIKIEAKVDIFRYKYAILKIMYELACYWLGDDYLRDETGEFIRNCFIDNQFSQSSFNKYPIRGRIDFVNQTSNKHLNDRLLTAWMMPVENMIGMYVSIFNLFEGYVCISENNSYQLTLESSKYIEIDAISGEMREISLLEEIHTWVQV